MFTDPRPQGRPACTQTAAQLLSMRAGTGFGKRFRCLKVTGRCNQTCWHWIWDQDTRLWQKALIETTLWVTCSVLVMPVNSEKGIWSLERCLHRLAFLLTPGAVTRSQPDPGCCWEDLPVLNSHTPTRLNSYRPLLPAPSTGGASAWLCPLLSTCTIGYLHRGRALRKRTISE